MYFTRGQWREISRVLRKAATKNSIDYADRIDAHLQEIEQRVTNRETRSL